ncbi:MAG: oligoendopeptidase F [Calditrichia bacterium]
MNKSERFFSTESKNIPASLPARNELPAEDLWNTADIFTDDDDWEQGCEQLKNLLEKLDTFRGKLRESAEMLLNCLRLRDEIDVLLGKLYLYAGLKNDEDTTETKYQEYRDRAASLMVQTNEKNAFFQPEVLSIPEEKLWSFFEENPDLQVYRHYFEDMLRLKPHILPYQLELLLAMSGEIGQGPYNIFSMFNNADIKFPTIPDENNQPVEVTKGRYNKFMESPNRRVRQDAFEALYNTYNNWTNTLAATLSAGVKKNIFYARSRKYENAPRAALHGDNVPETVYENVVNSINRNLEPLHRYMHLRKRALRLNTLNPWDLSVPLVADLKIEIPYEEAKKTISSAMAPLGDEYISVLQEGFKDRWIDVRENKGKRSGAYSWSTHGVHPFVLLNYNNTLDDVFTVAHEMGHALHSYFTHKHQPVIYSSYTIFVAEVASTLNEALLIDYLLKTTEDKTKKLYLLNQYADQIRGTVYIQTLFAEFEKKIHEESESGIALTAEHLNQLTSKLYSRYLGPAFELTAPYEINWCRIPHFYYNFYVYKYVTGFSAATALSQKIIDGDETARGAYLKFLSRGCSDYSLNLLKDAGVDMTSTEPLQATTQLLGRLVDEMENLLD